MPSFTWRNCLTVSVSEMSRTQALDCARSFDLLAQVYPSLDDLVAEADVLCVIFAPCIIKVGDRILEAGTHIVKRDDGDSLSLTLPLTSDSFKALPMGLTEAWINAAVSCNEWIIDALKKNILRTINLLSEQKSDSAPLNEPTPSVPMTETTGQLTTLSS